MYKTKRQHSSGAKVKLLKFTSHRTSERRKHERKKKKTILLNLLLLNYDSKMRVAQKKYNITQSIIL